MSKRRIAFLPALTFLLLTVGLSQEQNQNVPLVTFSDLQQSDSIQSPFRIVGYVLNIYKCPPCPPGAMCKPCVPNNIIITDAADPKDLSRINRLRIFTEKPHELEPKKKYSFTVKLKHKLSAGQAITDVDLVSFEPLK